MRKVSVVITGQVRNDAVFLHTLAPLLEVRKAGHVQRIILSTWSGEIDKYEGLRRRLDDDGVDVIEQVEPTEYILPGYALHQTKSLHAALQALDADQWVLKTRADVFLSDGDTVKRLITRDLECNSPAIPCVLRHRLWAPHFEISQPFFIADQLFFGHYHDVCKLCNYDYYYEVNRIQTLPNQAGNQYPTDALTEVRRFINPFLAHFPILRSFIETARTVGFWNQHRAAILKFNLSQGQWWEYIAIYYFILHHYFDIGGSDLHGKVALLRQTNDLKAEGRQEVNGDFLVPIGRTMPDRFLENFGESSGHACFLFCDDSQWLENIFDSKIEDGFLNTKFFKHLVNALNHRRSENERRRITQYQESLGQVLQGFQ